MRMARTDGLVLSVPGDRKPPNRPTVLRRFHAVLNLDLSPTICPDRCRLVPCEAAPDRLKPRVPGPGRGSAW